MKFRPLHSAEDLDSPFNRGAGFVVASGGAVVLLWVIIPLAGVALKLIGM